MVPSPSLVTLNPDARQVLKGFLDSRAGENFVQALNALCPSVLERGTAEDQIAAANRHAGYEKCIENMLFFIEPLPPEDDEKKSETYPDLEDEKAWKEEQKRAETAQN